MADWDSFNPHWYAEHNYAVLRDDDRALLELTGGWFAESAKPGSWGLDAGAGANLYPALSMLPFCNRIDLYERSRANVDWLRRERRHGYLPLWDQYWDVLAARSPYGLVAEPRAEFSTRVSVTAGDVFRLPVRMWDMGTMFFVAESITGLREEFTAAVDRFIHALTPGAPFAAAFMQDSTGYAVNGIWYPAVAVDEADVYRVLSPVTTDLQTIPVLSATPLREGYQGMVLALGRAR